MGKKIAALLLIVLLTGLLGGCWSRREITEVAVVLGTGVDLAADGRIRLTVQIARPGAFAGPAEGGGRGKGARLLGDLRGRHNRSGRRKAPGHEDPSGHLLGP